ncbi:MAG: hypothetical protein JNL70_11780 [Saprospiraceae bacterium]|nr:hypothetical protein [Saprospiraceae bacterium]
MSKLSNNCPIPAWLLLSLCLNALTWSACPLESETETANPQQPNLYIFGVDLSKSFGYERLSPQYIRSFCQAVGKYSNAAAVICIYRIGAPSNDFSLKCELEEMPIQDENALLSKQAENTQKIIEARAIREKAIETFVADYAKMIANHEGDLQTDFQSFLDKSLLLVTEYSEYTPFVFVFSDAKHDLPSGTSIKLPAKEQTSKITWSGCGLKNTEIIEALKIRLYESPSGYLKTITNHLSKKEGQ